MDEKKRAIPDWHEKYANEDVETMPWYYPGLDPDMARAIEAYPIPGTDILDLGTGPGTQAVALAQRGFRVTGTDISAPAVAKARARYARENMSVCFVEDDILDTGLVDRFDAVFDRGCFHVFPEEKRNDYVGAVQKLLRPGGLLFLKCFSTEETMEEGPYRFTPEEMRGYFEGPFEILEIRPAEFQGTIEPFPKALFCIMKRR